MKLYDFDGMFEEKLAEYIKRDPGRLSEEEWEDAIPRLYEKFGGTVIKSIGTTPRGFYAAQSDEQLFAGLSAHLKRGVPVNKFLRDEVEKRRRADLLLPLLGGGEDEALFAVNVLGAERSALPVYLGLVTSCDSDEVRNACIDCLKEAADDVKESVVDLCEKGVSTEYMLEILSCCKARDERVFTLLLNAFRTAESDALARRAGYLAAYGDERAIPYLVARIEEEGISYADFRDLKFYIEVLGGSYDAPRDFSSDPDYELIKSHGATDVDIFKNFK